MILQVNSDLLRKVKDNKGCLCKFQKTGYLTTDSIHPLPCPCDEPFKLKVGETCHCGVYQCIG